LTGGKKKVKLTSGKGQSRRKKKRNVLKEVLRRGKCAEKAMIAKANRGYGLVCEGENGRLQKKGRRYQGFPPVENQES